MRKVTESPPPPVRKREAELADLPPYEGPSHPRLRFLGTGTSAGVPILGCQCSVCKSKDPRDHRLRTAALLETRHERILIDAGPDIREQLLPLPFYPLDAVLLTHIHYDHVGGIDDLRGFCTFGSVHIHADKTTLEGLHRQLPYCFAEHLYPGVPLLSLHEIEPMKPFNVGETRILPFPVMHGHMPILGFRIGRLAYITDMKSMEPEVIEAALRGVDTLVVNALRWHNAHHSHMTMEDALALIAHISPRQAFIVHMTHRIGLYREIEPSLPPGVHLAYDGLEVEVMP